jgi:hypothetical protein
MAAYDSHLINVSIENTVDNLVYDSSFYFQLLHYVLNSTSHSVHFSAVERSSLQIQVTNSFKKFPLQFQIFAI